jgi:DNA-binding NarL/FixJ family response regulator
VIRVLLVDDQHLVRAGLAMLCGTAEDVEVVGEAENGHRATELVARLRPDVVLMDLRMPGVDGTTATARITAAHPRTRVLVLTTFDDDEHLYPALAAGAHGFLAKDTPPGDLLAAVRRTAAGEAVFSPHVLTRVVRAATAARRADPEPDGALLATLTDREREVLALVGDGHSNAEIAARLHVGITTVKTHVANLMTKTATGNRVRLAVLATRNRITPDP